MKNQLFVVITLLVLGSIGVAQTTSSAPDTGAMNAPGGQQITNGPVAEYVADSNATIGWSTKDPATMSIKYGTERSELSHTTAAAQNTNQLNHHARLTGLRPNTTYFFQVQQNGEPVGGIGTFRTVASGGTPTRSAATISEH